MCVNEIALLLKASVTATAMDVKAQEEFVACDCLPPCQGVLGRYAHEKSFIKALIMIQSIKKEL